MDPTGKLLPTNFVNNALQIGGQNSIISKKDRPDAQETQERGKTAAEHTGELGRKETEKSGSGGEVFLPVTLQDAQRFQEMDRLRELAMGTRESASRDESVPPEKPLALPAGEPQTPPVIYINPQTAHRVDPRTFNPADVIDAEFVDVTDSAKTAGAGTSSGTGEKVGAKTEPPPFTAPSGPKAEEDRRYAEFDEISKNNKQLLKDVASGKIPVSMLPDLPLSKAEGNMKTLIDCTLNDRQGQGEPSLLGKVWNKIKGNGPRETMQNYDRYARMATDKLCAQNPKLDKDRLYLYNMSQMILNDRDPHGKPRLQNMAISAHQYVRSYEGESFMQAQQKRSTVENDLEGMMSRLTPSEQDAVLKKEEELENLAMLMASRGRPMSQQDIQAIRASNMVELGRAGKLNPDVAAKAKEYLMNSQDMASAGINDPYAPPQDMGMYSQDPYMSQGYPPGMNVPGGNGMNQQQAGNPQMTGMPGMPGMPGSGFVPPQGGNDMSGVLAMLMMQERASRMHTMMMMMMVGGPSMLPYAMMLQMMPSSLSPFAMLLGGGGGMPPMPGGPNIPPQNPPGGPQYPPQYPQNPQGPGPCPPSRCQKPFLLEKDDSWLNDVKKESWLDSVNKNREVTEGEQSSASN